MENDEHKKCPQQKADQKERTFNVDQKKEKMLGHGLKKAEK